jgi:hypothetical protein
VISDELAACPRVTLRGCWASAMSRLSCGWPIHRVGAGTGANSSRTCSDTGKAKSGSRGVFLIAPRPPNLRPALESTTRGDNNDLFHGCRSSFCDEQQNHRFVSSYFGSTKRPRVRIILRSVLGVTARTRARTLGRGTSTLGSAFGCRSRLKCVLK